MGLWHGAQMPKTSAELLWWLLLSGTREEEPAASCARWQTLCPWWLLHRELCSSHLQLCASCPRPGSDVNTELDRAEITAEAEIRGCVCERSVTAGSWGTRSQILTEVRAPEPRR